MSSRLNINPQLKSLVATTTPDIFAYAESMVYSKSNQSLQKLLPGYDCYHHTAVKNTCRRGITVFFLERYRWIMAKVQVSKKYDILWFKMENEHDKMVFCFFYAPGENRQQLERGGFYDELREGYKQFSKKSKVFFLGDTNARLGSYSQDKNVHGQYVSNINKSNFLGFLEYSGLVYLNGIYARGQPTYEIANRKKSIIDVGLTNHLLSVRNFEVLPHILGVNPQTCHKILKLTLTFSQDSLPKNVHRGLRNAKFRYCRHDSLIKIRNWVSDKIGELINLRPDDDSIYQYSVLKRLYEFAKTKFLGYVTERHQKRLSSHTLNRLQLLVRYLTAQFDIDSTELNLIKLRLAHNQLTETWKVVKQKNFAQWLDKLNRLNQQQATRSFFSELRNRTKNPEVFGPIENSKGILSKSWPECLKNWSDFYTDLYKDTKYPDYDFRGFPNFEKISPTQLQSLNEQISISDVAAATYTFKNFCSPGADMILNRDLTCLFIPEENDSVRWEILRFIHRLFSAFWAKAAVPDTFKQSIIRPFLKPGKDPTKRGNYRPISLLNVPLKLYEQVIKTRLVRYLEESCYFSQAQAAYRKGRSTADHLLVLQELFFYYRYTKIGPKGAKGKQPLYLAFMDLRKAFDSVPRKYLFQKLAYIGITGTLFNVLKDIYSRNKARVRIDNKFSAYFEINSGVMQGSKLGPILFIFYINDLLRELIDSKLGAEIKGIFISALGFADDIVLIADCPKKLQGLLDICYNWCSRNGMQFNNDKCKVMTLNSPRKDIDFRLGETILEKITKYKYLGVVLSNKRLTSLYTHHFKQVIERAEKRLNCIRHFGFDSDGLRPATCISMYKVLVRPILEYASQALSYRHYYFTSRGKPRKIFEPTDFLMKLEQFQNRTLKRLIPCPKSTPCCLLRLLTGTISLVAHIDILKLRYFWKLTHSGLMGYAQDICRLRRKNFLESNVGYVHEIFNLCCEYKMMWVWHGTCSRKNNPLALIKRQIVGHHLQRDLKSAAAVNCVYTNLILTSAPYGKKYTLCKFLRVLGFFKSTKHRRFFMYSFLDTCAYSRLCPACHKQVSDVLTHALNSCPRTRSLRLTLRLKLILFNISKIDQHTRHGCKTTLYSLAMGSRPFKTALCEFLMTLGYYYANP